MKPIEIPLLLAFSLAAACSAVDVHVDHDPEAKFDELETFAWRPSTVPERREPDPLHAQVRATVAAVLQSKGYREVDEAPDFHVAAFGGTRQLESPMSLGYRQWQRGRPVDVFVYQEESLVIDIIDPAANHLIWQGQAKGALGSYPTPGERAEMLEIAARSLLDRFPPE